VGDFFYRLVDGLADVEAHRLRPARRRNPRLLEARRGPCTNRRRGRRRRRFRFDLGLGGRIGIGIRNRRADALEGLADGGEGGLEIVQELGLEVALDVGFGLDRGRQGLAGLPGRRRLEGRPARDNASQLRQGVRIGRRFGRFSFAGRPNR
jgi:hypothetical protein